MTETAESRQANVLRHAVASDIRELESPAVRAANEDLQTRVAGSLHLVISVLIDQRNRALTLLDQAHEAAGHRVEALAAEHGRVIASMNTRHQKELETLRTQADDLRSRLDQAAVRTAELAPHDGHNDPRGALMTAAAALGGGPGSRLDALERQVNELVFQLEAANTETEETRADAVRLQGERDDALRATDDVRVQLVAEIEAARDETTQVQAQLDETLRLMRDGRDQARDEQCRLIEEIDDLRRELKACGDQLALARRGGP